MEDMDKGKKDFTCKYFNDPLYGGVSVSKLELELINTPIFQRLRGLKQLAHVNYVFPGAEHTRFIHSIGVLHIMGLMTTHLLRRGDLEIDEVVNLRVAALLHDIGHYPLSHLGESAYSYCKDNVVGGGLMGIAPEQTVPPLHILSSSHSKSAHHEELGKYIIENHKEIGEILDRYEINKNEIGSIIRGKTLNTVYSQLLHSSLDADRLDYLLRDSYQTGVRYGLVDFEYLIRLLEVTNDVLVCNKKGQHVVEHFLMCRYFHYSQVIGHKTSLAFEGLLKSLYINSIIKNRLLFNSYKEITDNINDDKFLNFNDSMLYQAFYDYYKTNEDQEFNLLYENFIKRRRPKNVYEIIDLYDKCKKSELTILEREVKKNPEEFSKILGVGENRWGYNKLPINVECIPAHINFNESDDYEEELREAIKVVDSNGDMSYLATDRDSVISKMADFTSETFRIFVVEEENQHLDYDRIKRAIDSHLK